MSKRRLRQRAKQRKAAKCQDGALDQAANVWLSAVLFIGLTTGAAFVGNHFFTAMPTSFALLLCLTGGLTLTYALSKNKAIQRGLETFVDVFVTSSIFKFFD